MVLLNHFVPFLIKSHFFLGVDDFGTTHPEIQKSRNRRQVVEAWLSVAMRSMAGLAGLTGVPLLQALGATAKAGDLPLPLGFPLKSLGRVFQDFLWRVFTVFTWLFMAHSDDFFGCFHWALRKNLRFRCFFFSGFVSWWSSFLGRKQRRWGNWPNGILTSNLANKEGNPPILTDWWYTKKVQKWVVAPNPPPFFFLIFWSFWGIPSEKSRYFGYRDLSPGWVELVLSMRSFRRARNP